MKLKTIVQDLTAVSVGSALLLAGIAHAAPAAAQGQFEVAKHYALSGADGWDYVGYDAVRHHLFISRGDHVRVFAVTSALMAGIRLLRRGSTSLFYQPRRPRPGR